MFESYNVNKIGLMKIEYFRNMFEDLANKMQEDCEQSRYLSIALTKLEEASMFVNKCIAEQNQE